MATLCYTSDSVFSQPTRNQRPQHQSRHRCREDKEQMLLDEESKKIGWAAEVGSNNVKRIFFTCTHYACGERMEILWMFPMLLLEVKLLELCRCVLLKWITLKGEIITHDKRLFELLSFQYYGKNYVKNNISSRAVKDASLLRTINDDSFWFSSEKTNKKIP